MSHELTKEEEKVLSSLRRLERNWPHSFWLFVSIDGLHVMYKNARGQRAFKPDGYADPAYEVCRVNIECDGGEW